MKKSTWTIVIVVAVIVVGYFLWKKYQASQMIAGAASPVGGGAENPVPGVPGAPSIPILPGSSIP